ncbi:MAG: phosphoribosylamine--glycine ligase [Desulfomicrobium sp.]|nr:phosphoribosylamine--glycine ligase [Desulfomicrobium sp.]
MKILLVGSGGREHSLAWKISQSARPVTLFIAPGNGGTASLGQNIAIQDKDIAGLVAFAKEESIDLVVAGPELPLVLGLKDALAQISIPCFGPDAFAAQLEGSKVFSKNVMRTAGVPTANFQVFEHYQKALDYVLTQPLPVVIKADGLAAGKGVIVATTLAEAQNALHEIMVERIFGAAGDQVIIEEALVGEEASFLAFCDGQNIVAMPSLQDHKRVGDNDTGSNTGGMGAYSPAPIVGPNQYETMANLCIRPILQHMADQGHPFVGILYAGIMMTKNGPMILEYNVRFGDPECQPLMVLLETDLVEIMQACVQGRLNKIKVQFSSQTSCCVVMASQGYPGSYPKGMAITGIEEAEKLEAVAVFQAGTAKENGQIISTGGRVLGVTATGNNLEEARNRAYAAVKLIHFDQSFYRSDIAVKGLRRTV